MAPAKNDDENLKFLYTCFQSAVKNSGKVDWKAVAETYHININAASMRLYRMKKALGTPTEETEADDNDPKSAAGGAPMSPKTPKIKAEGDENGGNSAAGGTPKSLKTSKAKAPKATPGGFLNINSNEERISTSAAVAKGKGKSRKRKLDEEDQVAEFIQRAGIEALTHSDMNPQAEID